MLLPFPPALCRPSPAKSVVTAWFMSWPLVTLLVVCRAKFRNNSLQRIIRLPNLSVRADSVEEVEGKHTFQIIDQMQI